MSRKGVSMAVGVAALIGLSGAYFALKGYNEDQAEQEAKEAEGEEILNIDSASVAGLEFTVGDAQVSFVQEDEVWKKADDETFPVDETTVLSPVSQLAPLNAVRILEDVEDISEYGIDEPQNTIVITDTDGNETEIVIGATNSATGDDYVMINGDMSVIYTVSSELRSAFSDDLYDYAVSEEIPYLQASEVTEVSVEKAEGSYKLYLEDAMWKAAEIVSMEDVVADVAESESKDAAADGIESESGDGMAAVTGLGRVMDADSELINDALADLSGLSYTDYVEHNCEDASAYGLGEDAAVLTVYWQEEVEAAEEDAAEEVTEDAIEAEKSETKAAEDATEAEKSEPETAENGADAQTSADEAEETKSETEAAVYETYSLTFRIGNTDDSGNYYVQQEGSKEVHTISYSVLSQFLDVTAESWELIGEETETETEAVTVSETEE